MALTVVGLLAYTAPIFKRGNILKDENKRFALGLQVNLGVIISSNYAVNKANEISQVQLIHLHSWI